MRDALRLGNAHRGRLSGFMNSDGMAGVCRVLSERRIGIEQCSTCPWRNFCQGGCMGMALDRNDTVWSTDPFCGYLKKAYRKAFEAILEDFSG